MVAFKSSQEVRAGGSHVREPCPRRREWCIATAEARAGPCGELRSSQDVCVAETRGGLPRREDHWPRSCLKGHCSSFDFYSEASGF